MSMLTRALPMSIVAVVLALFSPLARAGEAEDLAAACIRSIARTADRATERTEDARHRTIAHIHLLVDEGAPAGAIIAAARQGKTNLARSADAALGHIGTLTEACAASLRELDAPPALIAAVREAAERARHRIREATRRSNEAINAAVDRALG